MPVPARYTERVDEVLDCSAAHAMVKQDFVALACAALDQAGLTVGQFADACMRAGRRASKTGTWAEYVENVMSEVEA